MRRGFVLLAAALCLVLAVLLVPTVPREDTGVVGAVSRSMGGARVFVIDALFLRAEAQRKAGRAEEAAALYETALEMDPANEAATIFLVNLIADDLMSQEPDAAARVHWWHRARALLKRALERRPESASLHARAAGLALEVLRPGAPIKLSDAAAAMAARVAFRHLLMAARATATLPRLGRAHLIQFSLLAPEMVAEALERGEMARAQQALAAGQEILALRGRVLASVTLEEASLADILGTGLAAVEAVSAYRGGQESLATARSRIEACRQLVDDWQLLDTLEALLDP